ncbi:MAG: complex I subunit 4 family protein [candidate division WOR-3 bacterium]
MALLTAVILFPLAMTLPVFFMPERARKTLWVYAIVVSGLEFLLSLGLLWWFDIARAAEFQFHGKFYWLPAINSYFQIGIDGMSLLLVLLTTFLTFLGFLSSIRYIETKRKEYIISMLVMEAAMVGVFSALDTLLFFVFWEAMLIPMYFLIGVWGHENRLYAAFKFILYTMAGSVLLLSAIIWLYIQFGTFDLIALTQATRGLPLSAQEILFLAMTTAFAIKVPLFPFHTWLPHAHAEAPTAGSVLLAGVLLKMGVYGLLRFSFPMFPEAARVFAPWLAILALIGITYGALMTWVQTDLKRLIAYSSVAHLGFIVLGAASANQWGLQGAMIQMVNHGLSTGGLFFIAGMLYERRHTRDLAAFGGLAKAVPRLSVLFGIIMLSSVGLPGLNGFVGEFLALAGAFRSNIVWAVVGVVGIILAAVYLLTMFQKVVFSKLEKDENAKMRDLSIREVLVLAPLIIFILWIGIYPQTFLRYTEPVSASIVQVVSPQSPTGAIEEPSQNPMLSNESPSGGISGPKEEVSHE